MTLQGASPRRCGAPFEIMLYYPDWDFSVLQRNRMRPRPQRGQGWRKGGFKFLKKVFYRAKKSGISYMKHGRTSVCIHPNLPRHICSHHAGSRPFLFVYPAHSIFCIVPRRVPGAILLLVRPGSGTGSGSIPAGSKPFRNRNPVG